MRETLPFITIAMPVYNSNWSLEQVLKSILDIDYPKKLLRLVFVDGSSTDGTWETLQFFKEKYADQYESIILVRTFKRGIGRQRNLCLDHVKG
jgi:glycosyltransferase involved in cell wall biosynthesis